MIGAIGEDDIVAVGARAELFQAIVEHAAPVASGGMADTKAGTDILFPHFSASRLGSERQFRPRV